jgi:hypothetical protein
MADYRATYTSHTQTPTTSHPFVGGSSHLRGLSFLLVAVVGTTQPPWCGSSTVFEQDGWTLVCRTVGVLRLITNIQRIREDMTLVFRNQKLEVALGPTNWQELVGPRATSNF